MDGLSDRRLVGAGMLVNAGDGSNWFADFLQYISPLRYINELMLRRMLEGRREIIDDHILEELGFTWGVATCWYLVLAYMGYCLILGWFLTWCLNKSA